MDTSKYKALYLQETNAHLSGIETGLLELEKGSFAGVDDLFRHYHSIKGMSASMGYEPIMKLAHAEEDLLDKIRGKSIQPSKEIVSTLFECLDALKNLVMRVEEDIPLDVDIAPFLMKIKGAVEGRPVETRQEETAGAGEPELRISHMMKVEGKVFDDLLTTVGDLFMALSSFKELSHASRSIEFKDGVHLLGKSINAIHNNILSARMLPIKDLTEGLPRVIRDLSNRSGKEVQLRIEGANISLDRAILENLGSPLVHIIRNSVDHGLETPDERVQLGKPAAGTILLKAYTRKDHAILEISDDGRGIDSEKIKKRAVEKGLDGKKVSAMTPKEALMLVCLPGVSSADTVTDTSGRGVGMDVVKGVVEGLGGALEIDSVPGKGTTIRMELPRTTSIIKALLVSISGELFLFPITKVEKVIETGSAEVAGGVLSFGDVEIPVVGLGRLLGMEEPEEKPSYTVIVVENSKGPVSQGRSFIGFKVDDFGAEMDAYVKPLIPPISRLWGVTGTTILSDGRPVFLLDLPQIISKAVLLLA
ncbi:MAG: chemotaxis protein CheW [Deltaproteobacteria bacterium]|nr:chemotaxis protein CheW [Deltaproteobacteria bacterium]